jgi:hypothetical protein
MSTKKTVTLDLEAFEHICGAIHHDAEDYFWMSRDRNHAERKGGYWTEEAAAIWSEHAARLNDIADQIKIQTGLPRG